MRIGAALLALFAVPAIANVALAQVRPAMLAPERPVLHPPAAIASAQPLPTMLPALAGRPAGSRVPLAMLPPLPAKTASRMATPGRVHTMAADGSTLSIVPWNNCGGTSGTLYNVGCQVQFTASGLPTGSNYQDYYIAPGAALATAVGAVYTTAPNGPTENSPALTAGLWTFATFNTSTNQWETVVYVNVGTAVTVQTYQDAYHTQEAYQFDAANNGNVYIQANSLNTSDTFVVYVEQTSVNPQCVFNAPGGTVTANKLCDPTSSPGMAAPGGTLSVAWPITPTMSAGTYSVVIYDQTLGQRLAQTQVSLTPQTGYSIALNSNGANANPSPRPLPASQTGQIFAWDSVNDQSTSGISLTTNAPVAGNRWTISDPTGHVVYTTAAAAGSIYSFQTNPLPAPGGYVPKIFTANLYTPGTKSVIAATTFQVVGYYVATTMGVGGVYSSGMVLPYGGSTTGIALRFTNASPQNFGLVNSDGISKIMFTTGYDFVPTNNGSGAAAPGGTGVYAYLNGQTPAACVATCTQTVTDSNGNSWTASDTCSADNRKNGECVITVTPVAASTVLAPGAYVEFTNATFFRDGGGSGSSCVFGTLNLCPMHTSELPQHGMTWSSITSNDASNAIQINTDAGVSKSGTASMVLNGAYTAGTAKAGAEAHLYKPYSMQAVYHRPSPYAIDTTAFDTFKLTVNNTGTGGGGTGSGTGDISEIAIGLPGSYSLATAGSNSWRMDPADTTGWTMSYCTATFGSAGTYLCLTSNKTTNDIAQTKSLTFLIDGNAAQSSFAPTDWQIYSAQPYQFAMSPIAGNQTFPVYSPAGASTAPSANFDNLVLGMFSLNSGLMQGSFAPTSAGANSTATETINITNTSLAADANPDYLDNILIANNTLGAGTITGISTPTTGWQYITTVTSGGTNYLWFSACSGGQATVANLPPVTTPLSAIAPQLPACAAAKLANAIGPGKSLQVNLTLNLAGVTTQVPFTFFAHGANVGGWTTPGTLNLPVTSISASAGFTSINGTAVANNTTPTVGGNVNASTGNTYIYSIKNTSQAGASNNITTATITIPGLDTSGLNATDSSGQTWTLTPTGAPSVTLGGNVDGCTIVGTPTSATTAGGNGSIAIGGGSCALKPGDTITVTFTALAPSSQADSYQFPTTVNGNIAAGENWKYDTYINENLSIGLDLIVNPGSPGPGGSTPVVSCGTCLFAGSTIDFGAVANNTPSANFTDVVRASVYIVSSTAHPWSLTVSTTNNPVCSPGTCVSTNELLTAIDNSNSSQGAGITFGPAAYTVVPGTASPMTIASGTSITTRSIPYDVLESFKVSIGNEFIISQTSTITYTLIAN